MESDGADAPESITGTVASESEDAGGPLHAADDIDLERLLYDPEYRRAVRGALKLGG